MRSNLLDAKANSYLAALTLISAQHNSGCHPPSMPANQPNGRGHLHRASIPLPSADTAGGYPAGSAREAREARQHNVRRVPRHALNLATRHDKLGNHLRASSTCDSPFPCWRSLPPPVPATSLTRPISRFSPSLPWSYRTPLIPPRSPESRMCTSSPMEGCWSPTARTRAWSSSISPRVPRSRSHGGGEVREYVFPGHFYPQPDGTTLLNDFFTQRFLVIDDTGGTGDVIPFPKAAGIGIEQASSDDRGRIYFRSPFGDFDEPRTPGGIRALPDSLAIMRWDPASGTVDTAGWVAAPKIKLHGHSADPPVFTPGDAWGVAPDGGVARVTPDPYRIIWYTKDSATAGPIQPYTHFRSPWGIARRITKATRECDRS